MKTGEWSNNEIRYLVIQSTNEMSFADIARMLGRNYKSVETKIHKLRKRGVRIQSKSKEQKYENQI